MPHVPAGQAGAHQTGEIEITEEMIEAGADVLLFAAVSAETSCGERELARDVFLAMLEARTPPPSAG